MSTTIHERADEQHPHKDEENELFPRVLTTKLVADHEAARERRQALQSWVIGAGLGLLALGLPLYGPFSQVNWSAPGPRALVHGLAEALGMPRERLGFAASALFLALALPMVTRAVRRFGFAHEHALPCSLLAILSPLGWLRATTAGDFFLGVVVAAALMHELASHRRGARALLFYAVGALLHAEALLYLPALVLWRPAGHSKASDGTPRSWRPAQVVLIGGALAGLAIAAQLAFPVAWSLDPLNIVGVPLYLAFAVIGLIAPWVRRAGEVARPPAWYLALLLAPLPGLVVGEFGQGSWLIPLAAAGLADLAQHSAGERSWVRWTLPRAALQLGAILLALWMKGNEAQSEVDWHARVRAELEPGDLVVIDDPQSRYLITERWDLEAISSDSPHLKERLEAAHEGGQRVVLATIPPAGLPELGFEPHVLSTAR